MPMSRDQLVHLLTQAAELEHALCCSYLFAAFSIKRSKEDGLDSEEEAELARSWAMSIILVAREEMEHLGLVNNMLTAIGGAPHFRRPDFPFRFIGFDQPVGLERFTPDVLERFIRYEVPEQNVPVSLVPPSAFSGLGPVDVQYSSVGELYQIIREGFRDFPGGEAALFVGPPAAQVSGMQLGLDFPRLGKMGGVFDFTLFPVTDMASAERAIDLIVEQGEGGLPCGEGDPPRATVTDEPSHWARFRKIQSQWKARPGFDPSRPVVSNPTLSVAGGRPGCTRVEHPPTRRVMAVFNAAYELTLLLLIRFYAHTDESEKELEALRYAAFFPMMTMVIRPLSEVIVQMPALGPEDPRRAGPSFEVFSTTSLLPHRNAAWTVLTERMAELAAACREVSETEGVPERVGFIAESLELLSKKFAQDLRGGDA